MQTPEAICFSISKFISITRKLNSWCYPVLLDLIQSRGRKIEHWTNLRSLEYIYGKEIDFFIGDFEQKEPKFHEDFIQYTLTKN